MTAEGEQRFITLHQSIWPTVRDAKWHLQHTGALALVSHIPRPELLKQEYVGPDIDVGEKARIAFTSMVKWQGAEKEILLPDKVNFSTQQLSLGINSLAYLRESIKGIQRATIIGDALLTYAFSYFRYVMEGKVEELMPLDRVAAVQGLLQYRDLQRTEGDSQAFWYCSVTFPSEKPIVNDTEATSRIAKLPFDSSVRTNFHDQILDVSFRLNGEPEQF